MSLTIRTVDAAYVHQTWPLVKGFVEEALTKGHDFPEWAACYNEDHVLQFLASGQWLLIVAVDEETNVRGACSVSFINYPLHRVAFVTSIGGKLIANRGAVQQLKQILKSYGATKIQGSGSDAIVRLWKRFNFEPRNTLVEVLL